MYFLILGIIYLLDERGIIENDRFLSVSKQRITIILMNITGFLLLAYKPNTFSFNYETLLVGFGAVVFFLFAFMATEKIYKNGCPLLWNGMFFLMDVGLIMLQRLNPNMAKRQLIFIFLGFVITLIIPFAFRVIPKFEKFEKLYLLLAFMLLVSTSVFGSEKNGAVNWIKIFSFTFQPSEVVKFLFIFYVASIFRKDLSLKQLIFPIFVAASMILILVYQKDLGGALIFFMTFMIMLYISTGSEILFFLGLGSLGLASVVAYKLFSHVRVRVVSWQNPWNDFFNTGNQIMHSLFAIGTWGLLGSGLTRGMPYKIPVVENDFIFAAICEEFGGIFAICIIGVFVMIYYRGVHVSLRCKRKYYSLLAAGLTAMMTFQTFLIIGGVIKFIPLTGVTLPFISYGGSSILVSILMIGIIEWLYTYYEDDELTETSKVQAEE